jgi:hypothetical protein
VRKTRGKAREEVENFSFSFADTAKIESEK